MSRQIKHRRENRVLTRSGGFPTLRGTCQPTEVLCMMGTRSGLSDADGGHRINRCNFSTDPH